MSLIISSAQKKQNQAANRQYLELLRRGGKDKVSSLHETQLSHYLRETVAMDKIMKPTPIDASDPSCITGTDNDTLFKRVDFQPELKTFLSSFEATPHEVQEIFVPRVYYSFYVLASPKVVINELTAGTYAFPVVKQVEDLIGPSMHEAVDFVMLESLEGLLQLSRGTYGNVLRGVEAAADIAASGINTGFRGQIERDDVLTLRKYFSNRRSRCRVALMAESDWIDYERLKLDDFGDERVGAVQEHGLSQETIHGLQVIRTIKTDFDRGDLLRPGNIYGFASQDAIGESSILQGIKFYVDRDHQFLTFDATQVRGFLWAIASRVAKVELYNGGLDTAGAAVVAAAPPPPAGEPFSDDMWGSVSDVTFKDYFNVEQNFRAPLINFS